MNLEDLKISHVAVGIKETHRALEKQNVKCVFITKKEIGRACGIKVKAAACAVIEPR